MQLSLNALLVMDCVMRFTSPTHKNDPCAPTSPLSSSEVRASDLEHWGSCVWIPSGANKFFCVLLCLILYISPRFTTESFNHLPGKYKQKCQLKFQIVVQSIIPEKTFQNEENSPMHPSFSNPSWKEWKISARKLATKDLTQGCAVRKIEGNPVLWNCKI